MNLDIPKMGHFILYEGGETLFQKMVIKEQRREGFSISDSQYTHIETSGGGQWTVAAVYPMSKLIDITKRYKGRKIKIVKYKDADYDTKRYKVAFFAATKCNLSYGWFSLLWFKINDYIKWINPWASINRPFCSYLCAWALCQVYDIAFVDAKKILPAAFLNPEKFELVWEGVIE